jgi:hypothetical protein
MEELKPAPSGFYGIFAEPKGHNGNPQWLSNEPVAYDVAIAEADHWNRTNNQWHYYAKPLV